MRVLITGAGGQVGRDVTDVLSGKTPAGGRRREELDDSFGPSWASCDVIAADHQRLEVTDRDTVLAAVEGTRPDVIVHSAAWTAVDACEGDPGRAFAVNALGTRHVVEAARRWSAHVIYLSTDYVFDGASERPYVEWDAAHPLSVYGRSKLGGELELDPGATVVRTSWVCGAHGNNMVRTVLRLAAGGGPLGFVTDQRGCPTMSADLAGTLAVLARDRLPGVFHVTNQGVTSWYELAREVVRLAGGDPDRVEPIVTADLDPPRPAPRPANSALDNAALRLTGLRLLPDWHDALARLVRVLLDGSAVPRVAS